MNMTNALQIKITVLSQVLGRSIIVMNNKHCNKLSSNIMPTLINIFNMYDIIWEEKLWLAVLDDNDRMKTMIDMIEFSLKLMTLDACSMKR
jgi:hypothetical protein